MGLQTFTSFALTLLMYNANIESLEMGEFDRNRSGYQISKVLVCGSIFFFGTLPIIFSFAVLLVPFRYPQILRTDAIEKYLKRLFFSVFVIFASSITPGGFLIFVGFYFYFLGVIFTGSSEHPLTLYPDWLLGLFNFLYEASVVTSCCGMSSVLLLSCAPTFYCVQEVAREQNGEEEVPLLRD